jgi:hypothetical protein
VDEKDALSVGVEPNFPLQCSEKRLVLGGDMGLGPREGLVAAALFLLLPVGAPAIIAVEAHALV